MSISPRSGARGGGQKITMFEILLCTGIVMSPLVPLLGEMGMCAYWLFCMKFNSQQLLFAQFFDIKFHRRSTGKWIYFPISVQYNIWNVSVVQTP